MTEYFDEFPYDTIKEIEENPDSAYTHIYLAKVDTAFSLLGIRKGGRVLELGCGTGYNALKYPGFRESEVISLDISRRELQIGRSYAARLGKTGDFIMADARYLPFRDDSFDAAFCVGVLHHIPDHRDALGEMIRVSRRICCIEPNNLNPLQILYRRTRLAGMRGDIKAFYLSGLKENFEAAQVKNIRTRRFLFTLPFLKGRLLKWNVMVEPILEKIPLFNRLCGALAISGEK